MLIQIAACGSVSKAHTQTAHHLPGRRFAVVILRYLLLRLLLPALVVALDASLYSQKLNTLPELLYRHGRDCASFYLADR